MVLRESLVSETMEADDAMRRLDQAGHLWRVLQSKLQAEETKLLL